MKEQAKTGISRRSFLTGAAATAHWPQLPG